MRKPSVHASAVCIAFAFAGTLAFSESFTEEEAASHARMVEELKRIEADAPKENLFVGTSGLELERRNLADLTETTASSHRFGTLSALAINELNQGLEREAIAHFEEALSLVEGYREGRRITNKDVIDNVRLLSTAYLRLGETENCCAAPNPESCIFPLSPAAVHDRREGSEKAIEHLTHLLEKAYLSEYDGTWIVWLLNLGYMTLGEYPGGVPPQWLIPLPEEAPPSKRTLPVGSTTFPPFRNVAAKAGVDTFSLAGGAATDDFDGDGDIDIVVSSWDPSVELRFFQNDGSGKFEEREAGFDGIKGGLNLVHADFDNDGDLDIFVTRGAWLGSGGQHPNSLLKNDGTGNFVDITYAAGLAEPMLPTQAADWADYDLDGDLDLFIGNENPRDPLGGCQLFRNDGGHFTDVAQQAGVAVVSFVKGVSWGDYDGDRYPDLVLSCMEQPNRLFRNRGDGTFEERTQLFGPQMPKKRNFPGWFFDYNNDGWLDIFIGGYASAGPEVAQYLLGKGVPDYTLAELYRNEQGEGFVNATREAALVRPMLPMGANFGDLTNNGFPDLYLGTGMPDFDTLVPNNLFINDGGRYYDMTQTARVGHLQKGHAVTFADFDSDGDLDIFEQMGGALAGDQYYDVLFENPGFGRNWLNVQLRGKVSNRFGVGCRVAIFIEEPGYAPRWIFQWMSTGGSFGSNPLQLHFGLGNAAKARRLEVLWPTTGKSQALDDVAPNQTLVIEEETPTD